MSSCRQLFSGWRQNCRPYGKNICPGFYYDNVKISWHYTKMHTKIIVALKTVLLVPCCRVLYQFEYAFSSITLWLFNIHAKSPEIFAFDLFCSKMLSSSLYAILTLSKTTSPQKTMQLHDAVQGQENTALIIYPGGGGWEDHFTFFHGKSSHFASYFIPNNPKIPY